MPFYRSPIHKRCKAAADSLSAEIIRKRLDYWTLVLGPKFSKRIGLPFSCGAITR